MNKALCQLKVQSYDEPELVAILVRAGYMVSTLKVQTSSWTSDHYVIVEEQEEVNEID